MLGKLKEGASGKAMASIEPLIAGHLEKLAALPPETVRDDESFRAKFIAPAMLAITAISGGATALIPRFNARMEKTFFHLRDELVIEKEGRIQLVDDHREKLPGVLRAGFKE